MILNIILISCNNAKHFNILSEGVPASEDKHLSTNNIVNDGTEFTRFGWITHNTQCIRMKPICFYIIQLQTS